MLRGVDERSVEEVDGKLGLGEFPVCFSVKLSQICISL